MSSLVQYSIASCVTLWTMEARSAVKRGERKRISRRVRCVASPLSKRAAAAAAVAAAVAGNGREHRAGLSAISSFKRENERDRISKCEKRDEFSAINRTEIRLSYDFLRSASPLGHKYRNTGTRQTSSRLRSFVIIKSCRPLNSTSESLNRGKEAAADKRTKNREN